MVQAIFLDIDGTLVSFKSHQIPSSTIKALKKAHQKGIKIFIATGRPTLFINNIDALTDLGLIDGYITMNGSYCYVGNKVIYQKPVPKEGVRAIVDYCDKGNYTTVLVGLDKITVFKPSEFFKDMFYKQLKVMPLEEIKKEDVLSYDVYQISPFIDFDSEAELKEGLRDCEVVRWTDEFADIGAKGNTKQLGIDKIITHFGINLNETIAFGDGGNDITMLKHAAIGVAMGNAKDVVKEAADFVTTSVDDDGIENGLIHFGVI